MGFDRSYFSINYFDIGGTLSVHDSKEKVTVTGDSSVFTMNLALDFIRQQAAEKKPFFAYVCFGSPHSPHQGAEEFTRLYGDVKGKNVQFLAEVSGVDDPAEKKNIAQEHPDQVARMRDALQAWQRSVRDSFDRKDYK